MRSCKLVAAAGNSVAVEQPSEVAAAVLSCVDRAARCGARSGPAPAMDGINAMLRNREGLMLHRTVRRHAGDRIHLRARLVAGWCRELRRRDFPHRARCVRRNFKFWAAEIDKRTQGRVQFKPSYSGALTSAVETLGAVRNGVVPVGLTAASFGSGALPALGYLEAIGGLPNDAD